MKQIITLSVIVCMLSINYSCSLVIHSIKKSIAAKKFSDEKIQQIIVNKSTKEEIKKIFGKPTNIIANSNVNQTLTGENITKKQETWIYVDYGKVLNIVFINNIVQSFQFTS